VDAPPSVRLSVTPRATVLPVPDINNQEDKGNDFTGMLLTEINVFVRDNEEALKWPDTLAGSWVVIDQKGLETLTGLVCFQYDTD
jgi:hypothetical protein